MPPVATFRQADPTAFAMIAADGIPEAWPALLSREQLCAYAGGISDTTLRKVCPVPAVDLGANVLKYRRAEVDAWLALPTSPRLAAGSGR